MSSTSPSAPPVRRGFFTTPSWSRSAVAMSLLLGAVGCILGSVLVVQAVLVTDARAVTVARMVFGSWSMLTGIAALVTGLHGVRAWQQGVPVAAVWFLPGLAASVLQGTVCSGGLAYDYFIGKHLLGAAPAWQIALLMASVGGIPLLGSLCCAGAWWVGRERPDGEVTPDLQ